jgi:RNA polymerase sigma-70 factor (ECF subfamily)
MPGYKFKNEEEVIEKAKNNPKIFGELYDFYYPKIFGYIFRITGDHAIACDITSETFLKAWLKIGSFKWKGISISSWFFKIATNELNQYYRKKKYTPDVLLDSSIFGESSGAPIDHDDESNAAAIKLDQADEFRDLYQKLKTLPPKYQKVIALRYFEEMSIKQVSEINREGRSGGIFDNYSQTGPRRLTEAEDPEDLPADGKAILKDWPPADSLASPGRFVIYSAKLISFQSRYDPMVKGWRIIPFPSGQGNAGLYFPRRVSFDCRRVKPSGALPFSI